MSDNGHQQQPFIQAVLARMDKTDRAILQQRAHDLARVATQDEAGGSERIEILLFTLGTESYALDVYGIREVRLLEHLTPVPCAPDFVAGVTNIQGDVLSLVDLGLFLGISQTGISDLMHIIIVESAGLTVGFLTNQVGEVRLLARDYFELPPATVNGIHAEYISGVTSNGLILLDLETILQDGRMIVNEEVS